VILDTDHDGMLSIDQLWQALHMIAFYRTTAEISKHITSLGSLEIPDRVNMDDYIRLLHQMASEPSHNDLLTESFRAVDRGRNGYVTFDQLKQILEQLGDDSTDDSFNEFVRSLNLQDRRIITINELIDTFHVGTTLA
jgi:Ca2+-binding EF-hand superfamily protein